MSKLNINGEEYSLKFTVGFWKKISELGLNQGNWDTKLNEDFGNLAPKVILAAIVGADKPTVEDIEGSVDRTCIDVLTEAYIAGMTKPELELLALAQAQRKAGIDGLMKKAVDGTDEKK